MLALLTRLAQEGFALRVEGTTLYVSPKEKLTNELKTLIKQHKEEILQLVNEANGFIPVLHFPSEDEVILAQEDIRDMAKSKTVKQWVKLRDKSIDDYNWITYNAYARLRKALDRGHKAEIEAWTYILYQLTIKRCGD
ncbi:MAG: hypothetical protein C0P72_008845 [Clostridia bacterium]